MGLLIVELNLWEDDMWCHTWMTTVSHGNSGSQLTHKSCWPKPYRTTCKPNVYGISLHDNVVGLRALAYIHNVLHKQRTEHVAIT